MAMSRLERTVRGRGRSRRSAALLSQRVEEHAQRGWRSRFGAAAHEHEPRAIGRDIEIADPVPDVWTLEELAWPADVRPRRSQIQADAHHRHALDEEQLPAAGCPERTVATVDRDLHARAIGVRGLHIDLVAARLVRHVRKPPSVK